MSVAAVVGQCKKTNISQQRDVLKSKLQQVVVVSSVPGLGFHLSHLGLKGHPPSRLDKQDPICPTLDLQVIPAAIPPHTWDSRWDRWDLFHVGLKRPMILGGMGRSLSVPPRIQRSSYLPSS